eukprot:3570710-Pleurochrysis_carterae.AAC.1
MASSLQHTADEVPGLRLECGFTRYCMNTVMSHRRCLQSAAVAIACTAPSPPLSPAKHRHRRGLQSAAVAVAVACAASLSPLLAKRGSELRSRR